MAQDLLLEIGVEEMPAKFMPGTLTQLKELAAAALEEARLEPSFGLWVRRIALFVRLSLGKGIASKWGPAGCHCEPIKSHGLCQNRGGEWCPSFRVRECPISLRRWGVGRVFPMLEPVFRPFTNHALGQRRLRFARRCAGCWPFRPGNYALGSASRQGATDTASPEPLLLRPASNIEPGNADQDKRRRMPGSGGGGPTMAPLQEDSAPGRGNTGLPCMAQMKNIWNCLRRC